ncbi:hypothetical protein RF11_09488 [Thelohanellus kitauei]|uniref:Uncharacterized protein n=1 Tax=Thelohanellus kitauei TaxID=669202 RepID=A0A0C2MSP4_THEKT|nr:hypothetical protein RF11_09488 [Thelohanellus kitauei]
MDLEDPLYPHGSYGPHTLALTARTTLYRLASKSPVIAGPSPLKTKLRSHSRHEFGELRFPTSSMFLGPVSRRLSHVTGEEANSLDEAWVPGWLEQRESEKEGSVSITGGSLQLNISSSAEELDGPSTYSASVLLALAAYPEGPESTHAKR